MIGDRMESEQGPEKATDMEAADFLIRHMDEPCEVVVNGKIENIRYVYINEAEKLLPTFTDPVAKKKLEDKIKQYKP